MRKIKFRAWCIPHAEYHNYVEIYSYLDGSIGYSAGLKNNTAIGNSENFIIEQFTGLEDKNGVDGYEGDIVKYKVRSYKNDQKSREEIGVILWDNMKAGFYIAPSHMYNYFKDGKNGSFRGEHLNLKIKEIIGNIHQNPELLK